MYDAGDRHFYIDELARLKDGNYVIPVRWLEDSDGIVFADALPVIFDAQVQCFLLSKICDINTNKTKKAVASAVDSSTVLIKASDLHEIFWTW